jgi:hypothetical protein
LRPAAGPLAQGLVAVHGGGDALLAEQLAVLIQRGRGVGGLVGSTPIIAGMRAPFSRGGQENTGRAGRLWARGSPLWSHSRSVPAGLHNRS